MASGRPRVTSLLTTWLGLDTVSDPNPTVAKGLELDGAGFGEEARQELLRGAALVVDEARKVVAAKAEAPPLEDRPSVRIEVERVEDAEGERGWLPSGGVPSRDAGMI